MANARQRRGKDMEEEIESFLSSLEAIRSQRGKEQRDKCLIGGRVIQPCRGTLFLSILHSFQLV